MGWPIPPKDPDLDEVLRVIAKGREHAMLVHGDLKIHDDCLECQQQARELHRLSGRSGSYESDMSAFRAKQASARSMGKSGKLKQSIPRVGDIESIIPEIMEHDRLMHNGDGEVHLDCTACKELCRRCLQSIGMSPQDYMDSFELMPDMASGSGLRPEILLEIAKALIAESTPRIANPWSYSKELD